MSSQNTMLINLLVHFGLESLRELSIRIGVSSSVVLNWSSGRSSPSLEQVDNIAYRLNIEASQLIRNDNLFSLVTPLWKDNIKMTFYRNIERYRMEQMITSKDFDDGLEEKSGMSYRSFSKYLSGLGKIINLVTIDKIAKIFEVEPFKLLESEDL